VDTRRREDILKEIGKLAASYTPEWHFSEEDPDLGSVLALLYADQMEENIRRYNTLLERDYVEFVNMMGVSPRPACPAHSIAVMDLVSETVPGLRLSKGVKLLGGKGDSRNLIFETAHSVYVTKARIKSVFMASGKEGKIIPIAGVFPPVEYVPGRQVQQESEAEESEIEGPRGETASQEAGYPFTLFDFSGQGYGKTGVLFYHPYLFDVEDNDIRMRLRGGEGLVDQIFAGKYRLFYYGEGRFIHIRDMRREGEESLVFQKKSACEKQEGCGVLLLEAVEPVKESVCVEEIGFTSSGKPQAPEQVFNGNNELDGGEFLPFGETISLYSQLYVGHEAYFSKPGADISITFELCFACHVVSIPRQQEEEQLKVIKRKPKKDVAQSPAEVYVDQVTIEYFNGTGWRRLRTAVPLESLFAQGRNGSVTIAFRCPEDWQPLEIGGFNNRCLRLQVAKADNCYYQPAVHHYPVIKGMHISYTYGRQFQRPSKLLRFQGSGRKDLSRFGAEGMEIPLFEKSRYDSAGLYVGFDQKMEEGPVSLLFSLGESEEYSGGSLSYSYSTRDGFARLKLLDHTEGLSHTGILLFMPPSDMARQTIEGQEAYWLKITDEKHLFEENSRGRPVVYDIRVNAAEVDNIDTQDVEDYYMDSFGPGMEFQINAKNILSVDVWVNEMGQHPMETIRRMLLEQPGNTMAEYNFLGEVTEFYVRWSEVDNFDRSAKGDRHYVLDRMNGRLCFGDGVHVRIPKNVSGISFKVRTRCCDGKEANLPPGHIRESFGGLLFLEEITNPIQAYGGVDMESMDEALHRGTNLLNGRERLVSAVDYEREVLNFSHHIVQVKAVAGKKKNGGTDYGAISLVLLMDDYREGHYSFIHLRQRLKEHILSRCELSVSPEKLDIVEPLFVEVSVEAWVRVVSRDDLFEVQQALVKALQEYLDPVKNNGWEIGQMVRKEQIELCLNMEKGRAMLQRTLITARYRDEDGYHEEDVRTFVGSPFIIVTSGRHRIHFEE